MLILFIVNKKLNQTAQLIIDIKFLTNRSYLKQSNETTAKT